MSEGLFYLAMICLMVGIIRYPKAQFWFWLAVMTMLNSIRVKLP